MTTHRIHLSDARSMAAIADESVHLVVTSPPYWQLKDYETPGQIGFDQSFGEYVQDLEQVWKECGRVLLPGCRACINVGDQFTRAHTYGRYEVLPIHAEVISSMRSTGFLYMGSIIWQKVTTCNSTGGGAVMGSYPFPRNGIVKLDYEYILLFKKPGEAPRPDPDIKEVGRLSTEEWKSYFSGHWTFPGARVRKHLAAFPPELPRRLIRMFSFPEETVLDPFMGSGVTAAAAAELGRNSIGYEVNPRFSDLILSQPALLVDARPPAVVEVIEDRDSRRTAAARYQGAGRAAKSFGSVVREGDRKTRYEQTFRVAAVEGPCRLRMSDGTVLELAGVAAAGNEQTDRDAIDYLRTMTASTRVVLEMSPVNLAHPHAFVRRLDRTFLNGKLISRGLARALETTAGRFAKRFNRYESDARQRKIGIWSQHETD